MGWRAALLLCACLFGLASAPRDRTADIKPGVLLYAMPGLPDPNFAKTVVLLLDHNRDGSLGVVLNRPTTRTVDAALDLKPGTTRIDLPVFWGGPVQPEAVLSLVRTFAPGPNARTILREVQMTPDLADVQDVLGSRDGRLRARVFSGYAGWGPGQLATEVRGGSWVIERAEAATVFTPEPSRLWEKVHEILGRLQALSTTPVRQYPGPTPGWRRGRQPPTVTTKSLPASRSLLSMRVSSGRFDRRSPGRNSSSIRYVPIGTCSVYPPLLAVVVS